jgi:hypothetical protein
MNIAQFERRITTQFFPKFRDKHIQTAPYDDSFIFPNFFLQSVSLNDLIGILGKNVQQF